MSTTTASVTDVRDEDSEMTLSPPHDPPPPRLAESSSTLVDDAVTPASVRAQCQRLAGEPAIDKETALRIVALHHDMETLLLQTSYDKDRIIRDLQAELNLKRLGDAHAEILRRRDEEILQLRQVLSQHQQQAQSAKGGRR